MSSTAINELNAFLKGEYMAINSYEKLIHSVKNEDIKKEFQNIQSEHREHASKISERIQNLGGKPVNSVGMGGKIAELISDIKRMGDKEVESILEEAYHGEDQGIKMAEEIVKGDLDRDSADIVSSILSQDRKHLELLRNHTS